MTKLSKWLLAVAMGCAYAPLSAEQQSKPPANPRLTQVPKAATPSVSCSGTPTAKACASFKELVAVHDKDILDSLSAKPTYVCFRPNEDAFLIFHAEPPWQYNWKKTDDGVGQVQEFTSPATLTEYREGVFYDGKEGRGYWRKFNPDVEPFFHSEDTDGFFRGLKINIDDREIAVEFPFTNQDNGTTQYSLTIRRSTGRFVETFGVKDSPNSTIKNSGTCLIYR